MEGSGQHQANPQQTEPANSQLRYGFLNLEREWDWEEYRGGSVRTTHTSKSHSRGGSHVSQREIYDLKKKLRRVQRKWSSSSSDGSFNDEDDASYSQGQELHPANLSPTMKSVTIGKNIRAHLVKVWEMTLWTRR